MELQNRRLTRRQRRRRKAFKEAVASVAVGLAMGGLLIAGFAFDDYEPSSVPEHSGQIEYCGQWWTPEDYEQMMAEREVCLESERIAEQEFMTKVQQAAEPTPTTKIASMDWDADESYMLAKIAMAEAEGEDTQGKALVILVVLNRVWSDGFPESIKEVITEEKQFAAYEDGRYDRVEPSEDCYKALELVMTEHWDESEGATYFERTSEDETWHNRNLEKLFTHGNHTFYKEADK